MLDRPICDADGADAIRQLEVLPDRDVRPFQEVLLDLGVRLGLPGLTEADGSAKYPGGYPDYLVNHERTPGIGPLAGWREPDGSGQGRGAPNPKQLDRYIENGCFWRHEFTPEQRYFKHASQSFGNRRRNGLHRRGQASRSAALCRPLQKFKLAAEGHGTAVPPVRERARIQTWLVCPIGTRRSRARPSGGIFRCTR